MANDIFNRSKGLLGEQSFDELANKTIAIFGLGGVGGTAIEALVRTGVSKVILIDFDKVDSSNINRQILYTSNDIGQLKVDVSKKRLLSINEKLDVLTINDKAQNVNIKQLSADFIIDAIDDVEGKIYIAKECIANNIPFIMSLGMANRFDPSQVYITKLNKTENDPLAKKMRHDLKALNFDISNIHVVASKELPIKNGYTLNSMMMVPSSAGLIIAKFVVSLFINK